MHRKDGQDGTGNIIWFEESQVSGNQFTDPEDAVNAAIFVLANRIEDIMLRHEVYREMTERVDGDSGCYVIIEH